MKQSLGCIVSNNVSENGTRDKCVDSSDSLLSPIISSFFKKKSQGLVNGRS